MSHPFRVIIPVRFASSRLPGKPLLRIGDKTLIEHVYLAAIGSDADEVIIATDDKNIEKTALSFGAKVIMTSDQHQSGTDRIAEAVSKLGFDDDEVIVNVQGDEYGIQSRIINTVAQVLHKTPAADIATLCEQIHERKTYEDVNSVKVVLDADNFALYFSRSPVPWSGDKNGPVYLPAYKHIGIYAYRSGFIRNFSKLARTALEQQESLEQLRALFFGQKIFVEKIAEKEGIEINTEEDLIRARSLI